MFIIFLYLERFQLWDLKTSSTETFTEPSKQEIRRNKVWNYSNLVKQVQPIETIDGAIETLWNFYQGMESGFNFEILEQAQLKPS